MASAKGLASTKSERSGLPTVALGGEQPTYARRATVGNLRLQSRAKVGGADETRTRDLRRDRPAF